MNVSRDEETVYMAQDSQGRSVTLVIGTEVWDLPSTRENISLSTAYIKAAGKIYTELVACKHGDAQ